MVGALRTWGFLGASVVTLGYLNACRTTEDMQRDYAQTLTPKKLEAPTTPDTETPRAIHEYKIRAYADVDYQRQSMQWTESIESQIARANRVLEAEFGVRLVVKDIKSWNRSGKASSLDAALAELTEVDPATDVDWVLGFVSSLTVFAASQEQLGRAYLPGHYLVLRGMFSLAEVDALNATLNELSQKERDTVTRERRLHKQTVVLLHEWAHSLGAFHELSGDWIMSPYYDTKQSTFSPESSRLLLGSLAHWGATDDAGRRAWAESYRSEVLRFPAAAADRASLDAALALSARLVANGPLAREPSAPPAAVAGASEAERQPTASLLKSCYVAQSRLPRADQTLATCRRAADAQDAAPEAFLLLGRVLLARKDVAGALGVLGQAETLLAAGAPDAATWVYLAQLYDRADTCTGAERAANRAPKEQGALQVLKDCVQQRRSVALPSGAKTVPFEREHEYVNAVQEAQRDTEAGRLKQAQADVHKLEKDFPGSPGPALIACITDGLAKNASLTKASCTAANAAAPEAVAPWLLLGKVASGEGRWEEAAKCLRRAIELDDNIAEAWRRLAAVYSQLGDSRGLADLSARYHAKFGGNLSPKL
jgi:tetratricopeptide (TPR) repeat protein